MAAVLSLALSQLDPAITSVSADTLQNEFCEELRCLPFSEAHVCWSPVIRWKSEFGSSEEEEDSRNGKFAEELDDKCEIATPQVASDYASPSQLELIEIYLRRQECRGSDVRLDTGSLYRPVAWPRMAISSRKWHWQVMKSVKYTTPEHINVLEMRMYLFSIRWRLRKASRFHQRHLHLMDSQVSLSVAAKGRSSSSQLNRILWRVCALLLASDTYPLLGYVQSKDNPADAPSRL